MINLDYTPRTSAVQTQTSDRLRHRFERIGMLVIPVWPGRKEPICKGWSERPPGDQWAEVKSRGIAFPNFGVVPGNGWAFFDPDSEHGRVMLDRELTRLGVPITRVQSATPGHGHAWVRVGSIPQGLLAKYALAPDYAPGDVRLGQGVYVLAPPSIVNGNRYRFERRNRPERLLKGRAMTWAELSRFIEYVGPAIQIAELPVSFEYDPAIPQWIDYTLDVLAGWTRPGAFERRVFDKKTGDVIQRITYASRTEAEQAVITGLIARGWTLGQAGELFEERQPGHYAGIKSPAARLRYFETSYSSAVDYVSRAGYRPLIAAWLADAQTRPWPGRTGELDRRVFIALLTIAWRQNLLTVYASVREVMTLAHSSLNGAQNALKRLAESGWITPLDKEDGAGRNYRAGIGTGLYQVNGSQWATADPGTWERSVIAVKPGPERRIDDLPGQGELWTVGKLGRTAGTVYAILSDYPQTAAEIARRIGKHRSTVGRALDRLADHELATRDGDGWRVGQGDPAAAADAHGARQAAAARRRTVEQQQQAYREQRIRHARRRGKGQA